MKKKVISVLISAVLVAGTFAGCGSSDSTSDSSASTDSSESTDTADSSDASSDDSSTNSKYKDFITVDVFDGLANYQGIQSGWFAKIDRKSTRLNSSH